jgi:hypothetical protein
MPKRNQKMFNDIATIIQRRKSRHEQGSWTEGELKPRKVTLSDGEKKEVTCGTSQCIAGWAVALSDEFYIDKETEDPHRVSNNEHVDWVTAGQELLGLKPREAERLFIDYPENEDDEVIPMGWPDALRAIGAGVDVEKALTEDVPRCDTGAENG